LSGLDAEQPSQDEETRQGKANGTDEDAHSGHHFQRLIGKAEDRIQGIFDQALERLFGFAPCPLLPIIINDALFEPDPTSETGEKSIFFSELFQFFHSLLADQTKDACLCRDRKVTDPGKSLVKRFKPQPSKAAFLPTSSLGTDDLGPSPPACKEIRDHFGLILQIAVHKNHDVSVSMH